MEKKYSKPVKRNYKSVIFWSMIALITLVFIIVVIVRFATASVVKSFNNVTHVEGEEILKQEDENYLVYLYSNSSTYSEQVSSMNDVMYNYITFQKRNSSKEAVYSIYVADLSTAENYKLMVFGETASTLENIDTINNLKINEDDVPTLVLVTDGVIKGVYDTNSEISDYLQKIIDSNK